MIVALMLACSMEAPTGATVSGSGAGGVAQEDATEAKPLQAIARLEGRSGSRMSGTVTFTQAAGTGTTPGGTTPGTSPGTSPGTTPGTAPGMPEPGMGEGHEGMGGMGREGMGGRTGMAQPNAPMQISVRLTNATPGNHAIFLHETGDCSAPDASSAGGFYNPMGTGGGMQQTPASPGMPGTTGEPGTPGASGTTDTPGTTGTTGSPPPGYLGFVTVGAQGRGEQDLTSMAYSLAPGATSLNGKAIVIYEKAPDFTRGGDPGARQACGVITPVEAGTLGTK